MLAALEHHPIRVLREERGVSINGLADLLETGTSTITNWEYMDRLPDVFGFIKLLQVFPDLDARKLGKSFRDWNNGLADRRQHPDHPDFGKPVRLPRSGRR